MKNKRILSLVLAFAMILGTFSFAFATPSDVEGTEHEDAITRLMSLDVLTGYPDGSFRPEETITRAEFAAVAVRISGMEEVAQAGAGAATGFTDVPANHWAAGYVGVAARLGIVNGIGNNKFAPETPVKYEEAITMIVRALGYEPAAKEKGAYPFGYLIVANDIGLLAKAKGTVGLPAKRGFVAQITDNALETAMMVQVGYGAGAKWVVSGSKEHGEDEKPVTLLGEMGFAHKDGVVDSINIKKETIDVNGTTLNVNEEDFDYNYLEGMQVRAWYDRAGNIVAYKVTKEALVGVAEGSKDEIEVAGDDYDVASKATLVLNGKKVDAKEFEADYAKVALNKDDEIVWAKGYTFEGFLVVEEVDGNDVFGFDEFDVNVKDYTLLKDGKTLDIEDIEEEDVFLYNRKAKFAMVYNDSEEGEIDRVYNDGSFKLDGEDYAISELGGYFLDGKVLGSLDGDGDNLAAIMGEEEEVEVFFDTHGDVVLVKGSQGKEKTNSFYAKVLAANIYDGRRGDDTLFLEVRNEEGKKVEYDIVEANKSATDTTKHFAGLLKDDITDISDKIIDAKIKDKIVSVTVNEAGNPTKLEILAANKVDVEKVDLEKAYAQGYRLSDKAVIFYSDKAVAVKDADFKEVTNADLYAANGRVVVIDGTAKDDATETVLGLVNRVRTVRGGKAEITLINGDRYTTVNDETLDLDYDDYVDEIVKLTVVKKSGLVNEIEVRDAKDTVEIAKRTSKIIEGTGKEVYELVTGAKVYDIIGKTKEIRPLDLKAGDIVKVYLDTDATERFVKFVVRVDDDEIDEDDEEVGTVTYINTTSSGVEIEDGKLVLSKGNSTAQVIDVEYKNDTKELAKLEDAKLYIPGKVEGTLVASVNVNPGETKKLGLDLSINASTLGVGEYKVNFLLDGKLQDETLTVVVLDNDTTVKEVTVAGIEAAESSGTYTVQLPLGVDPDDVVVKASDIELNSAKAKVVDLEKTDGTTDTWTFNVEAQDETKTSTPYTITLVETKIDDSSSSATLAGKVVTVVVKDDTSSNNPVKGLKKADFVFELSGETVGIAEFKESNTDDGKYVITLDVEDGADLTGLELEVDGVTITIY